MKIIVTDILDGRRWTVEGDQMYVDAVLRQQFPMLAYDIPDGHTERLVKEIARLPTYVLHVEGRIPPPLPMNDPVEVEWEPERRPIPDDPEWEYP